MDLLASAAAVSRALAKLSKPQKLAAIAAAKQNLSGYVPPVDPVAKAAATVTSGLKKFPAEDQTLILDYANKSVEREDDGAAETKSEAAAPA